MKRTQWNRNSNSIHNVMKTNANLGHDRSPAPSYVHILILAQFSFVMFLFWKSKVATLILVFEIVHCSICIAMLQGAFVHVFMFTNICTYFCRAKYHDWTDQGFSRSNHKNRYNAESSNAQSPPETTWQNDKKRNVLESTTDDWVLRSCRFAR